MAGGVFTGLDAAVTDGLNNLTQGQMALFSSLMSTLTVSTVALYILWRGYQTLAGKLQTPAADVAWDLARMGIIMTFVTNASGYLDATIAAINGLKDGFSGGENIWEILDTLWQNAQDLGQHLYIMDNAMYVKLNGGFAEFLVWGGTMATLIVSTIVNLCAEIILLLMATTAPIFIWCLMYGFLRDMFNNWLKNIFTVILTLLFSAYSLHIMINYLGDVLRKASQTAEANNMVTLGAQCALAGVGSAVVVWLSAKLAQSLAGSAVAGAVQGAAAVGLIGAAMATKKAASSVIKHTPGVMQGLGKGMDYAGGKAAHALSGYMNRRQLSKMAIENMKRASMKSLNSPIKKIGNSTSHLLPPS